jgi:hypothetical protein
MIVAEKQIVSVREKCGQRKAWMNIASALEGTRHLGEEHSGEMVERRGGLRDLTLIVSCIQGCR